MRTENFRRHKSSIKIKHKIRILKDVYGWSDETISKHKWATHADKNKVHCSCPMCSVKTKTHGWKASDIKRMGISKDLSNTFGSPNNTKNTAKNISKLEV